MCNLSIIIPIYNEETILVTQINRISAKINKLKLINKYEIILVENGSIDNTYKVAKKLVEKYRNIKVIKLEHPCYGNAFKQGIKKSRYDIIVQFDIDFWDINFLEKALVLLDKFDIIIGSKNLSDSNDQRPYFRKFISEFIELIIRLYFNVNISDTHGTKVMKKKEIIRLIDKIHSRNHFFDTELLIRCYHLNYKFKELPVDLKEIRKTRFSFYIRAQEVIKEFSQLLLLKKNLALK